MTISFSKISLFILLSKVTTKIIVFLIPLLTRTVYAENHDNDVVYLTLQECIQIALDNNLDIKIAKLDNWISGTEETYAKAVYDMILSGKVTYERDERQTASELFSTKQLTNEYIIGLEKNILD